MNAPVYGAYGQSFEEWSQSFEYGEGTGVSAGGGVDWSQVGQTASGVAQGLFSFLGQRQQANAAAAMAAAQQAQAQAAERAAQIQAQMGVTKMQMQQQAEDARARRQQTMLLAAAGGGVLLIGGVGLTLYLLRKG